MQAESGHIHRPPTVRGVVRESLTVSSNVELTWYGTEHGINATSAHAKTFMFNQFLHCVSVCRRVAVWWPSQCT